MPWREIDGEIIALDPSSSSYVSINGTGTLLWRCLVSGATLDQLAERLVDTYGIDCNRARKDVDEFVGSLEAHGWLES